MDLSFEITSKLTFYARTSKAVSVLLWTLDSLITKSINVVRNVKKKRPDLSDICDILKTDKQPCEIDLEDAKEKFDCLLRSAHIINRPSLGTFLSF